ncbi:hypothetical protein LTR53_004432 [Teratosphaeriaceae sp. CCFEE 6253]|nr:hypothetical protein LTR53_004432 [Teratosphaeriaceae sp. CCFEE 6253]
MEPITLTPGATSQLESTLSGLQHFTRANPLPADSTHTPHAHRLTLQVAHNLRHQHNWTHLRLHHDASPQVPSQRLPRPVISGLPPRRLYTHPDEQIEILQRQRGQGKTGLPDVAPEREWVVPSHLREPWSLRRFAEVFDALAAVPVEGEGRGLEFGAGDGRGKVGDGEGGKGENGVAGSGADGNPWRTGQPKRVLLATVDQDSTVVYYIVHDGIVKPRQN